MLSIRSKETFIKWLRPYFLLAAILPEPSYSLVDRLRVLYHCFALLISSSMGWIFFLENYNNFAINTEILLHAVLGLHTLCLYMVYLKKRQPLHHISEIMMSRFQNISNKMDFNKYHYIWDRADKRSLFVMKLGLSFCVITDIFYIFNAKPFSDQRKLLYPMWVPFSVHGEMTYLIAVGFQLSVFMLYNLIHVCGCSLFIGGSQFIGASLEALGSAFRDICRESGSYDNNIESQGEDNDSCKKLNLWIECHMDVLSLTRDFKSVFEDVLLEVMLCCEVVICFSGFQVILAMEMKDAQKAANLIGMVLLLVLHLFMFCYPGQHIYNKSEELRDTIYCSQWETQGPALKKHLIFLLAYTVKPISVSYRGVVHSSMHSFSQTLKKAYSYVSILLVIRDVR